MLQYRNILIADNLKIAEQMTTVIVNKSYKETDATFLLLFMTETNVATLKNIYISVFSVNDFYFVFFISFCFST